MSEGDDTDGTDIRPLDEDTVARIAAGEVVERPASAVKELVENSLDADADRIDVEIEAGGIDGIRVADDGRGMTEADLRAAVRQHTTSKITDLADLESGVESLGFRGEALHTIGSVSKLHVRSKPRGGNRGADDASRVDSEAPADAGTELVYEGGEVESVEPAGCPAGTVVEVTDLFYNTPARRKFLKTTATEFAHVNRVVTRYALANPGVAVSLSHDGREVFATTGQGKLREAVLSVYGREVANAMIPVEAEGEALPASPVESITGLVSHPETNRSSREYLSTYVNGRAITADAIREGIMAAYEGQLGSERYPFVVLFLDVPGDTVDVNVHPRKRDVRFGDDDGVRRAVDDAVESALLDHGLLRSRAPRGRSAPEETAVEPEPPTDAGPATDAESETEDDASTRAASPTEGASSTRTGEANPDTGGSAGVRNRGGEGETVPATNESAGRAAGDDVRDGEGPQSSNEGENRRTGGRDPGGTHRLSSEADGESAKPSMEADGSERARRSERRRYRQSTKRRFAPETEQRTLGGEPAGRERRFESLPALRIMGQLRDTYLVCETDDGLVLIDQHAADERVNYERLTRAFDRDSTAQALAEPVELELTAAEAEAFGAYREALATLGFEAERIDGGERVEGDESVQQVEGDDRVEGVSDEAGESDPARHVAVTSVPAVLEKTVDPDRLRDVLSSFVAGDHEAGEERIEELADEFLGDLACYPSITGNTSLTEGSVVDLLAALDDCENPYACPHGRPVIVRFDLDEIDDRFERDYPGHGG